ncbi:MAG: glycosyltransferase family 2 protein [Nitrospirae bacterium]|nr:glycosyltransferase family 2 protein [Nitrospirota bacterium]
MQRSVLKPLVTIGIPCYNEESNITQAVTWARSQTYPNIEVLISDAGSQDGTIDRLHILEARKEARVIYHPPGTSKYENWNTLVKESHGDFLLILVARHKLYPTCVEHLVAPFLHNIRLGYVRACMVWKHSDGVRQRMVPAMVSGKRESQEELALLFRGNTCETIATLYKTEALRKALPFDSRLDRTFVWLANAKVASDNPVYFKNVDVAEWIDSLTKAKKAISELPILYNELTKLAKSNSLIMDEADYRDCLAGHIESSRITKSNKYYKLWLISKSFLQHLVFRHLSWIAEGTRVKLRQFWRFLSKF